MQPPHTPHEQLHALRLEGREWIYDISLEQAWAILAAAFQEIGGRQELLFMLQLPNGDLPALCMSGSVFRQTASTPQALRARLLRPAPEAEAEPAARPALRPGRLRAVPHAGSNRG